MVVKLRKGDVLFFFSLYFFVVLDELSLYIGCLVIEGEKWFVIKWIYVVVFEKLCFKNGVCVNEVDSCEEWVVYGEC